MSSGASQTQHRRTLSRTGSGSAGDMQLTLGGLDTGLNTRRLVLTLDLSLAGQMQVRVGCACVALHRLQMPSMGY